MCKKNVGQWRVSLLYKRLFFQFDNRWRCERFMSKDNNICLFLYQSILSNIVKKFTNKLYSANTIFISYAIQVIFFEAIQKYQQKNDSYSICNFWYKINNRNELTKKSNDYNHSIYNAKSCFRFIVFGWAFNKKTIKSTTFIF